MKKLIDYHSSQCSIMGLVLGLALTDLDDSALISLIVFRELELYF